MKEEQQRHERLQPASYSPEAWAVHIEILPRKVVSAYRHAGEILMSRDDQANRDFDNDAFSILREEAKGTPFQAAMNALVTATPNEAVGEAWKRFLEWYARDLSALTRRIMRKQQSRATPEAPDALEQEDALRQEGELLIGAYLQAVKQWYQDYQASIQRSDSFPLQTAQEFDALARAQADGQTARHFKNDTQALTRIHQNPGAAHYIALSLSEQEIADGLSLSDLERFTGHQDADGILATCYVLGLLLPPDNLRAGSTPFVRVDLDDLVLKIGLDPRSSDARDAARKQVYEYLQFGERARVIGARTVPYKDKRTSEVLSTRIDAPLWHIGATQRPVQLGAFESLEVPRQVEITLTPLWIPLLSNPDLRQYIPFGELLASIPGRQAGGAWARVIGLSLANFWRRHPRETAGRSMRPTRRELLTHYTPKNAEPLAILKSINPDRARKYWATAIQILKEQGFVADEGEARKPNITDIPRKGWQDTWLIEEVELWPGKKMQPPVQECASSLPEPKIRCLTAKSSRRTKKAQTHE